MSAFVVVERKISFQSGKCFLDRAVVFQINIFVLHASPQTFHKDIVETSSAAIPANLNVVCCQESGVFHGGELRSLIGVVNFRNRFPERALERAGAEFRFHGLRQFPCKHVAGEPIQYDREITETMLDGDVRNVSTPHLVGTENWNIA